MSQKRFVLTTLFVASILVSFIHYTQVSALLTLTTSAFRLPIAPGLNVYVIQGNNDTKHDHVGKAAWAFDFIVGQSNFVVTATQGGRVIGADDSSITQCSGLNRESAPEQKFLQDCWTYANYVLIADDDGTTAALYMHLLPHSLKVSSGMHVNQGDPLGLAGTTGWSTGVHLHFQVEDIPSSDRQQTQPRGWWWTTSRPVSFSNPEVLQQDAYGVPKYSQSFTVSANTSIAPAPTLSTPGLKCTMPPTIKEVPTLTPQQGGGIDPNSPIIKNSIAEVQKLYPYLPYSNDITLSTGIGVSIVIPDLQANQWTLTAQIFDINYHTSPDQPDYVTMKESFREAAKIVFAWIREHNADPKKIIFVWGDRKYIQEKAELWLMC